MMTTRHTFAALALACFSVLATASCIAEPVDEVDEETGEAQEALVSTYYTESWGTRTVYARNFDPNGAPRVRWNGVKWGSCTAVSEKSMSPVPVQEITASLCASVGTQATYANGTVTGCVSVNTTTPAYLWKYSWFDPTLTQCNYNVIDLGAYGQIIDQSGWIPTPGNGCPR